MKKLILKNCQRVVEKTEFSLDGLSFLVGPNNAGKGIIKDSLRFISSLFRGDFDAIERCKESICRSNLPWLENARENFISSVDAECKLITPHEAIFDSQSAWMVGCEFPMEVFFNGTVPLGPGQSVIPTDELRDSFYLSSDLEGSEWLSEYEPRLRLVYSEVKIELDTPQDEILSSRSSIRQLKIQVGDRDLLVMDENYIALHISVIDSIGSGFFFENEISLKFGTIYKDRCFPGSLEVQSEDEFFLFAMDKDLAVIAISDFDDILVTGRYFPSRDISSRNLFFENDDHVRSYACACVQGIELLVDRLLRFTQFHIRSFAVDTLVRGDRSLPTNVELETRIVIKEQNYLEFERARGFYNVALTLAESRFPLAERKVFGVPVIDSFRRNTVFREQLQRKLETVEDSIKLAPFKNSISILELVNDSLSKLLGSRSSIYLDCSFEVVSLRLPKGGFDIAALDLGSAEILGRLELFAHDKNPVAFADVGSGIGYVLPVLIVLADIESDGISIIEQPELHLHPKLQGDLGDLIFQKGLDVSPLVIETHSEHLILRLLRRVRESYEASVRASYDSAPDLSKALLGKDLHFYYFQPISDTETRVHSLNVSPSGRFYEPWPDGFFEERNSDLSGFL